MRLETLGKVVAGALGAMYIDSRLSLRHDLHQIKTQIMVLRQAARIEKEDRINVYYRFLETAEKKPGAEYLMFEGQSYTYRQVKRMSNQLAIWYLSQGVKRGDVVAAYLQNHPSFVINWLALNQIGATQACINNQLQDKSLLHCLRVSGAKLMVIDGFYENAIGPQADVIQNELGITMFTYGEIAKELPYARALRQADLEAFGDQEPDPSLMKGTGLQDVALLIYTSGTTGLPKPAVVQHGRVNMAATGWTYMNKIRPDDRIYCTLPLYHSSAALLCIAQSWISGAAVIIGRKFSVSKYWDECIRYDATVINYIGEIARYLLAQPPCPSDTAHRVRLAYGNGMRPEVWSVFRERFHIPEIGEFYAATEGNGTLFNYNTGEWGSGAVGHRGWLIRMLRKDLPIVRVDPETYEPIRNDKGFCVQCAYGEAGELLIRNEKGTPLEFRGYYKDAKATQKKIIENVFVKGDSYFRTGDLLRLTSDGMMHFADRIGDTFRWKSENVSTNEVAEVVSVYPGIIEANVYGAEVPGYDGRAGMAALLLKEGAKLDLKGLAKHVRSKLPKYAAPLFIRVVKKMELTGTYKQSKVQLRKEGIDPSYFAADEVYWLDGDEYKPFGKEQYEMIRKDQAKL